MANMEQNPFAALLTTSASGINKKLIEDVFLFTLSKTEKSNNRALVCLADVIVQDDSTEMEMNEDLLSHALFERIMMTDKAELEKYMQPGNTEARAVETEAITYLYGSYLELVTHQRQFPSEFVKLRDLIITNVTTCMRQPELFQSTDTASVHKQWLNLLQQSDEIEDAMVEFLMLVVQKVNADDNDELESLGTLKSIFYPLLGEIQKQIVRENLITMKKNIFCALSYFVRDKRVPQLGELLIDYTTPNPDAKGGDFMETLFGQLLCISIMPKTNNAPYEFFMDINFENQQTDAGLWQFLSMHQNSIFIIVKQLLVLSPIAKRKTLQWIGNCLNANIARGHLWSSINISLEQTLNQSASDAFMIGLTAVLLRLTEPLCEPNMKVVLVDPTYCGVPQKDRQAKQINMIKADEETCLLPTEENEIRVTAETYNFITELFYMTHKSFELSYRACSERFQKMTRELHNLQTAYQDVVGSDPNSDLAKNLVRMLKQKMQQYLSLRNTLMEPKNDSFILKFFEASAIWLTEIALVTEEEFEKCTIQKDFAPRQRRNRDLPTEIGFIPSYLKSVPENLIDNLVAYLNFSRHAVGVPGGQLIEVYHSAHDAFFKMIVLFMGCEKLVKNPHLRAKLAEALEFLLPKQIAGSVRNSFMTHVFENHNDRLKVVRSLLNVFVSIEMTGQSVQFEQKFNYRRPMYAIMEYLWTKEDQVQCFRDLAVEAEQNMEAIEPPIFLRFINLLINDAIFLLDESLSNLEQIRQLQEAQTRGEWNSLSHNDRQQQLSNLQHLGMLARFDNILGRDTINILKLLTTEIKSIFCHNSMVDRIAAMLNYFLLNLVGPQKERFKVKDKKEFDFDPAQTVLEICRIYINLSCSDSFCLAISQDGRSYSSQLFTYADNILTRIGGGQLIGDMSEFAAKVQKMEVQYKQEQEFLADAPDEYLDPIMSTLMTDPVILPSSNVTVDRSTIARHLLSDQTDPFNRAPLTMDKVKPNVELKAEIEKWIQNKREASTRSPS